MSDLADFLLARIAEDEEMAQEALARASVYGDREVTWKWLRAVNGSTMWEPTSHTPARVLAECEAKRRIVTAESGRWRTRADAPIAEMRTDSWSNRITVHFDTGGEETMTHAQFRDRYEEPVLSDTLRLLALPYADHPDYREEWRP